METDKFIHFGQMSEGKKPSGRPTRRWEDNIEIDLKQTSYKHVDWINFVQDKVQWMVLVITEINLRKYKKTRMF
jgi:hypothetical protein